MYNNKKNVKRNNNQRRQNKEIRPVVYRLFEGHKTFSKSYDKESLIDILCDIPFDKISIPVYVQRTAINGNGKTGYLAVGYVKSFANDCEFEVIIRDAFKDQVFSIADPVIFARVAVKNNGTVKNIIGLDIVAYDEVAELLDIEVSEPQDVEEE